MRRILLICTLFLIGAVCAAPVNASPGVQYGIQDDAWLQYGPGSLDERLDRARRARRRPRPVHAQLAPDRAAPRTFATGAGRTRSCRGCAAPGSAPSSPSGVPRAGQTAAAAPNWAPTSGASFASFAAAAAKRYPWVQQWIVWNEPNQRRWLRPTPGRSTSAAAQPGLRRRSTARLPAPRSPAASRRRAARPGGMSPVDFIRGMGAARRPARRVRAPSVSARSPARRRHGRLRPLQDDHDGDARAAAARGVAQRLRRRSASG